MSVWSVDWEGVSLVMAAYGNHQQCHHLPPPPPPSPLPGLAAGQVHPSWPNQLPLKAGRMLHAYIQA